MWQLVFSSWLVVTKGFYLCSIYFEMNVLEPNLQTPSTALVCGFNLPAVCGSVKVCLCVYLHASLCWCVCWKDTACRQMRAQLSWSPWQLCDTTELRGLQVNPFSYVFTTLWEFLQHRLLWSDMCPKSQRDLQNNFTRVKPLAYNATKNVQTQACTLPSKPPHWHAVKVGAGLLLSEQTDMEQRQRPTKQLTKGKRVT